MFVTDLAMPFSKSFQAGVDMTQACRNSQHAVAYGSVSGAVEFPPDVFTNLRLSMLVHKGLSE